MKSAWIPNALTLLRILLVPPLVFAILAGAWPLALGLVAVAGLSDALDGWLARRYGWQSRLGGLLDPLADKLLLSAIYFAFWWGGHLPAWLFYVIAGRDLVILAGALAWHWLIRPLEPAPSLLGKLTTAMQVGFALALLLHLAGAGLPAAWLPQFLLFTAMFTLVSGVDYVLRWSLMAFGARRRPDA
jgi:cardiolipin synthase (CMP-forming)